MTSQSAVVSAALVDRVRERASREQSSAEVPLIVLDEMLADGWHLEHETRLESAKTLLVVAFSANDSSREDACLA